MSGRRRDSPASWRWSPPTFLNLVDLLGRPGVFFLYAALTFGAFVFARALVPETRGLSLEAVEGLWLRRARGGKPGGPNEPDLAAAPLT